MTSSGGADIPVEDPGPKTVPIVIDGRPVEAAEGALVIEAAQQVGNYIPRFCWHPRMNPVGMCRMCLIELETPRGVLMTTACTTKVAEGMSVITASDTVKKAQEGILEFLLINHPLDCPVCDRGGECPLQDQTMAYGPGESRFVEEKRHFEKPIAISDLVLLDRERCILCARCTRFSEEISGDPLIEFQDRGYGTQVNTFPDEPFRSYFSGNTVQICPVGALTATPYRFRARPWDLQMVESCSLHDTVHSRLSIQTSQNRVLRCNAIDHDGTNQGWLSDKERFGFEHVHSPDRLTEPLVRGDDGELAAASWGEALDLVARRLGEVIEQHGGSAVAALGGARGTNEDAYALSKFLRVAVGTDNVDAQMDDGLDPRFLVGVERRARIADVDRAGAILLWGPDLKEELGTLYLRVRRAAQERGVPLIVVHPRRTGLDDRATWKFDYRPGEGPETLRRLAEGEGDFAEARRALDNGSVVALLGRTAYTDDPLLAEAVAAFVLGLEGAKMLPLVRRANTYGALDMGLAPGLLPGRLDASSSAAAELAAAWGSVPDGSGSDCLRILTGLREGSLHALLLIGADPVRDVAQGPLAAEALAAAGFVVALDQFLTDSSRLADVVLPAEGFAEKDGTVTNLEGRVQRVNRVVSGPGQTRPDWSVLDDIADRMGTPLGLGSAEGIAKEIAAVAPAYRGVTWDLLDFEGRDGVVVPHDGAVQPLRYAPGDPGLVARPIPIALHLARVMYDDGVLMRMGPSLRKLAPGAVAHLHPDDALRMRVHDGDPVVLRGAAGDIEMPVRVDPSLRPGVVYVPFNQPGCPVLSSDPRISLQRP
jgi:NADH-quinone oxidoreductase subunit G